MTVAPHMVKSLPYDPKRDIAPITMGVTFPDVIVVHAGVPPATLAESVALPGSRQELARYFEVESGK